MSDMEIPNFLRKIPPKGRDMTSQTTTPAPAPVAAPAKTKTRRRDAYVCRISVSIPLDMTNAESLSAAIKAADAIEAGLPEGSKVTFASRGLGKI